jgi:hypothetical protein
MKKIILLIILLVNVCFSYKTIAQSTPCNITSGGLSIWNVGLTSTLLNNEVLVGEKAIVRMQILNFGSALGTCTYPIGSVEVQIPFVEEGLNFHYYKYDGPLSFSSGKFNWTYSNYNLVGINNTALVAGLASTDFVNVEIKGVKATPLPSSPVSDLPMQLGFVAGFPSDDASDNYRTIRVNVAAIATLPVTLSSFEGIGNKCDAKLNWTVSNEVNFKGYEIEVSKDGQTFEKVGVVNASISNMGKYQFNPSQPSGKSFYRLKMIDNDGKVSYSKIINVITNCSDKVVKVFPNPIRLDQLLNVQLIGYNASVKGDLYSASGQLVKSYVLKSGANTLSVENLAQGFYTLRVMENGTTIESIKINISK